MWVCGSSNVFLYKFEPKLHLCDKGNLTECWNSNELQISTFVPKVKIQLHKDHIFLFFCAAVNQNCAVYVQYSLLLFKANSYELKAAFSSLKYKKVTMTKFA